MPGIGVRSWADAVASGYAHASESTVLTDMGRCTPESALADRLRTDHWKLMPYELADGTSGWMVWTSPEAQAPPLALATGLKGLHAIFVGLFSGGISCEVRLRLESEPVAQVRAVGKDIAWNKVEEVFYKVAELDGRGLCLSQGSAGCGVAYAKLIPLSDREAAAFRTEKGCPRPRNQAATYDGLGILYNRPAEDATAEALLESLEGFRDTDFGTLLLQYGGADQVPYPSRLANRFGAWTEAEAYPENPGHRLCAESFRAFAERGVNPYQVLIEGAHRLGMAVQVSVRPAMWTFWEPYPDFFDSAFYREHPEWPTVDRDGTPVTRMSWAVPQVREHVIRVIQEAVQLGADGANVLFNRGMPVVLYEPPFVERFQSEHGVDPRELDEDDRRMTEARGNVIAAFLRELRAMLDGEAQRRGNGRKLALSAWCFGNEEGNLHFDLDLRRLVGEGLVDEVYPYIWDHLNGAPRREWDIGSFSAFCRPRGVKLSMWRDMRQWTVMSRMDRIEELQARQVRGPAPSGVFADLHMLNGQILDGRYPPYMGG